MGRVCHGYGNDVVGWRVEGTTDYTLVTHTCTVSLLYEDKIKKELFTITEGRSCGWVGRACHGYGKDVVGWRVEGTTDYTLVTHTYMVSLLYVII